VKSWRLQQKNSISMLMESGWKPEEMTAFWGQLISSGLSGEQAGTALKQMAIKERAGFGKMLAKVSDSWIDTEWLKGDAKHLAESRNKGLIEGFGTQGAELFKADPVKWLDRMGAASTSSRPAEKTTRSFWPRSLVTSQLMQWCSFSRNAAK